MPSTIHPSPNEVVTIAASEEIPKRISAPPGSVTKVYYGASVTDAHREVELKDDNLELDVAQPVLLLTDAATLILEGIQGTKPLAGIAYEELETDVKVVEPKEDAKKDQAEVAESNVEDPIPSLSK